MMLRSQAAAVAAALGLVFLSAGGAAGQNAPLRVLVSNGMKAAIEELRPQCERAAGRPLDLHFNSTAAVKKQIEAGAEFDLTIITSEAVGDLIQQGRLARDSRAELGRSELGIGIRTGAAKPDISTPEALQRTLRAAQSITYPRDGASRQYLEKMFERMGIAADLQPKIILAPGSGPATESVATGKAQFVITLYSEIVPVRGVEILGPLPGDFHYDIRFAAAASAKSKQAAAAKAMIAFLTGPAAAATFKTNGLNRDSTLNHRQSDSGVPK